MKVWLLYQHYAHRTWVLKVFDTRVALVRWLDIEAQLQQEELRLEPGHGWFIGNNHYSLDIYPVLTSE